MATGPVLSGPDLVGFSLAAPLPPTPMRSLFQLPLCSDVSVILGAVVIARLRGGAGWAGMLHSLECF